VPQGVCPDFQHKDWKKKKKPKNKATQKQEQQQKALTMWYI
jgi:hypothetical protein